MKKFIRKISAAALLGALAMGSVAPAYAQTTYTVQQGDWLWGIARQYGVSAGDIMAANGLTSEHVYPGTTLTIPAQNQGPITGDNGSDDYTGSQSGVHTVRSGDTLSGIASTYGVSVSQLQAWNGIGNRLLQIGEQIVLYGSPGATPPVTPDPTPTPTPSYQANYIVQFGDTLSGLAYANGVSLSELYAVNGLYSDWIVEGQVLIIPGVTYPVSSNTVSHWTPDYSTPDYSYNEPADSTPTTPPTVVETTEEEENTTSTRPTEDEDDNQDDSPGSDSSLQVEGMRVADLPERARPEIHIVEEGDTLASIATEYEIEEDEIVSWNQLTEGEEPEVDDELFVSNPALIPELHEVEEGESLYDIAEQYETTEQWLMLWNQLEDNVPPAIGELVIVSNPDPETHKVNPGETLQDIADQYEISLDDLRDWNGIPEEVTIVNGTLLVSDPRVGNEEELEAAETSEANGAEEETTTEETTATEESAE